MEVTATVWEWPIFIDLWAAGVAGGAYFAAFLINRLTGRRYKHLVRIATWLGVPLAAIGVLLLVLDLGNQLWFWHLIIRFVPFSLVFHPGAPMSIGTYVLSLWIISGVCQLILWLAEDGVPGFSALSGLTSLTGILGWISFLLSPLLIAYTGVLISATNVPLWATVLLPVLFVSSAVFTGTAAVRLVASLLGKDVPEQLGRASLILAALQALALILFLISVPAGVLVSGSMALWFWLGVVVVGLVVPAALDYQGLSAKGSGAVAMLSSLCVLAGGMILRAVLVIGGQMH
jgi:formate-dependent nitrite reductase membrane component NrfD